MPDGTQRWVAERYWPGVTEADVRGTLEALSAACAALGGSTVAGLIGGTWLPDDETLTTRFAGTRAGIVAAHELAHTTFDRLSRAVELPT